MTFPSWKTQRAKALAVLALFACAALSCTSSDEESIRAGLSTAPEALRSALFSHDETAFRAAARDAGATEVEHLERSLYALLDVSSQEAWSRSRRRVLPLLQRVVAYEKESFGFVGGDEWLSRLDALSIEEGRALLACRERRRAAVRMAKERVQAEGTAADALGQPEDGAGVSDWSEELSAIARDLERLDCIDDAARVLLELARLSSATDGVDPTRLHHALAMARRAGRATLVTEVLVDLCALDARRGDADSLSMHMNEAMSIATEHRLPRAADLAYFHSGWMQGQGRQGLAAELRETAVRLGREFGAGARELDFILMALSIHADFGNWHLVERDLHRAEALLPLAREEEARARDDTAKSGVSSGLQTPYEDAKRALRIYEGRRLMHVGDVEAAKRTFQELLEAEEAGDESSAPPGSSDDVALFFHWGRGLLDQGHAEEALEPIRRGLEIAEDQHLPALALRFRMLQLEAELELGTLERASPTFRSVFASSLRRNIDGSTELNADRLEAGFVALRGDTAEAWSLAGKAYVRWLQITESAEPSMNPHREIEDAMRLWELVRDLAQGQAELAYGCELIRSAGHLSHAPPEGASELKSQSARVTRNVLDWAERTGGAHVLYRMERDDVLRWCATKGEVRCDTLAIRADDLRDQVANAIEGMSLDPLDPDAVIQTTLSATLTNLGQILLPPEALAARTILVTADDFLRQLPFEALGVDGDEYVPLLEGHDVAYLRSAGILSDHSAGEGLIVNDPRLPDELRRRYPNLLPLNGRECDVLATENPRAVVLRGSAATKANLLATWSGAAWIYYAGHLVRDPENPFWTFLPLAAEDRVLRAEDCRLELIDIRSASLLQCRLVVLSGCRSGAPFVARGNVVPSLADGFLDAGAERVAFTFWDVRDDAAGQVTLPFFEAWRAGKPAASALGEARRQLLRGPGGVRHPFGWAVYGVQLSGLE